MWSVDQLHVLHPALQPGGGNAKLLSQVQKMENKAVEENKKLLSRV
jgi:hypothetical protein